FFFQAEDGIRVFHVTGVQTCALPIYVAALGFLGLRRLRAEAEEPERRDVEDRRPDRERELHDQRREAVRQDVLEDDPQRVRPQRSEERRVGKEGRARRGQDSSTEPTK